MLRRSVLIILALVLFVLVLSLAATPLMRYLILATGLFSVGIYGLLTSKSLIKTLIAIEILFNAASINLIAFSQYTDFGMVRGQIMTLFVMGIAAAEIAIGLALILLLYSKAKITRASDMREAREV